MSPITNRNIKANGNGNTDTYTMSNDTKCKVDVDIFKISKGHKREFVNSFSLDWVDDIKRVDG